MKTIPGVRLDSIESKLTYQLAVRADAPGKDSHAVFDAAVDVMVKWLRDVKLYQIPEFFDAIGDGRRTTNIEQGGVTVEIISVEGTRWGFRYRQPDAYVPARTWITQALATLEEDGVTCRVSNLYANPSSTGAEAVLTTPGFVRSLCTQVGLIDVRDLREDAWVMESVEELSALRALLEDPGRTLPVIVVSEKKYMYTGQRRCGIDFRWLAGRAVGLAHVVLLPYEIAFRWTQMVGKQWSVFDGAVRIYHPGLSLDEGNVYQHPLFLWDAIERRGDFRDVMLDEMRLYNVQTLRLPGSFDLFALLKEEKLALDIRLANDQNSDVETMMALLEEENRGLRARLGDKEQELAGWVADVEKLLEEKIEIEQENRRLDIRAQALQAKFAERNAQEEVPIPDSLDEVEEWCDTYLPERLVLSSKARRALKKGQYEDVGLLCQVLLLYADEYRNMRIRDNNDSDSNERYMARIEAMGLEHGKPISDAKRGERGQEYSFVYNGRRMDMTHHIGRGNAHDPKYTFRIYTSWDEDSGRVIVGSLPEHLETDIS